MKIETTHGEAVPVVTEQLMISAKMLAAAAAEMENGQTARAYKAVNFDVIKRAMDNLEQMAQEAS